MMSKHMHQHEACPSKTYKQKKKESILKIFWFCDGESNAEDYKRNAQCSLSCLLTVFLRPIAQPIMAVVVGRMS